VGPLQSGWTLRVLMLNQTVLCELTEKFSEIDFDSISRGAELPTDFIRDP